MRAVLALWVIIASMACADSAWAQLADLSPPKAPFDETAQPPAADYRQPSAWAAWPGVASPADTVPDGATPGRASTPEADVFFIHPTTYLTNDAWNARF